MFISELNPGPFSLLQQCRMTGRRVSVTIRHCSGIRGVCEGTLIVYDKHFNMVLQDVMEYCNPFRTAANGGISQAKKIRKRRKKLAPAKTSTKNKCVVESAGGGRTEGILWEMCKSVPQLFIRGDSVVYVSTLQQSTVGK